MVTNPHAYDRLADMLHDDLWDQRDLLYVEARLTFVADGLERARAEDLPDSTAAPEALRIDTLVSLMRQGLMWVRRWGYDKPEEDVRKEFEAIRRFGEEALVLLAHTSKGPARG